MLQFFSSLLFRLQQKICAYKKKYMKYTCEHCQICCRLLRNRGEKAAVERFKSAESKDWSRRNTAVEREQEVGNLNSSWFCLSFSFLLFRVLSHILFYEIVLLLRFLFSAYRCVCKRLDSIENACEWKKNKIERKRKKTALSFVSTIFFCLRFRCR